MHEIATGSGKTTNRNMEQGDRKTLSPETNRVAKPPLKKKAGLSDAGSGHLVEGKGKKKNWTDDYDNNCG